MLPLGVDYFFASMFSILTKSSACWNELFLFFLVAEVSLLADAPWPATTRPLLFDACEASVEDVVIGLLIKRLPGAQALLAAALLTFTKLLVASVVAA